MKTLIFFITLFSSIANAIEIKLKSGENQSQLIELYTSEGCSSCPPADRWLSTLKTKPQLFKDFVPVAFHVDYWDYIGWTDELAMPQNSNRQRQHKQDNNINSVYTPGVLKAGNEWRRWRSAVISASTKKVGSLNIELKDNRINAEFDSIVKSEYKLVIALLGMDIETKVMAGENKGKVLKHDFVVLKQQSFHSKNGQWNESISSDFFESIYKNIAFVAWVEKTNNQTPIQAVGTFLKSK